MSKRKTKAYKAKWQEESTSKVLLKSRIEALQKENYKRLNENPGVKLKLINALLISDYPQLIQQIFGQKGLVEILDSNNIELSTNEVVKIASLVLQNNAARSMQFLINSYGMLLGRNEKFIECAAKFLKDKEIINILIKDINFLRNDGKNLLHRAVDMDNLELIQILSELDKSMILQVDDKGFTALHYALAYLNKDLEADHPKKEKLSALKVFKSKNDKSLKVVEILIKSQSNSLNNKQLYEKILKEFAGLDLNIIDFPNDFATSYVLTETTKKSAEILAIYWWGLYNNGYSQKDWEKIKNEIASIITHSSLEHNIDLLNVAFEFFLVSIQELTIDNFIKCYTGSNNSKSILSQEIKLFILSKLAWYNDANGQSNLALSQSLEAIELVILLNDNNLRAFDWYNDAMYKIYLTYAHVNQRINKDYGSIEILEALEKAEQYAPIKNSFYYNIDKFVWYINAGDFNNPRLIDLVDNIDNIQIRNFLQAVRVALILPKNLFETEIDGLIGEITDAEKREVCQNLITRFRKDHTEDMGEYGIALNYYIERRDIVSMARICHKSKDTDIIKLAIKSTNDSSYSFQEAVRHELFQISKALIYLSLENFGLAGQALLDMETKELSSLHSHWKNLFCDLLADLSLNHNQNLEDYIIKLEQVDPVHKMLEVMRIQPVEEEPKEVLNLPPLELETPAIQPLTKTEVLKLSEQEFLREWRSGKIKSSLQKAYYKQLKQDQLQQEVLSSIKQCFFQNQEKSESWVLSSNTVIESNQPQVYYVNGNTWATIDQTTIRQLDFAYRVAFENAITKGFVRTKGSNGIKIIGNLAELKIDADLRLYTKIKYVNDHSASIIIFDKCGNHKKVRKELNENIQMADFPVPSISQDAVSALDLLLNPIEYKDYSLESLGQCNDQKDDGLLFE